MKTNNMKIIALLFLLIGSCAAQEQVTISGSETLIYLGQRLAQQFKQSHPTATVKVGGADATSGIKQVLDKRTDFFQWSKPLKPQVTSGLLAAPVAVEGVVVYVNSENPIQELSIAQLRTIFMGEITNWKALGGKDMPIELFAGESSTGILEFFQEAILQGKEPYPYWGKPNTKEMLDMIQQHPGGIGYSSVGSSAKTKPLRIKTTGNSLAVEPTITNIRMRKYPISRYVNWYAAAKAKGTPALFSAWVLSQEGQLTVEAAGLQPLTPEDRQKSLHELQ